MLGRLKNFISFNKLLKIQRNYRRCLSEVKQNFNPGSMQLHIPLSIYPTPTFLTS